MHRSTRPAICRTFLSLLMLLGSGSTGAAGAAELAFVLGTILEPEGVNEGDELAPGTLVRTGDEALVMVEHRWPSDEPTRACILLEIFGYGKSHRVSAEETPGRCETTVPNVAHLEEEEPFLSRETRYGDAKFDRGDTPEKVRQSQSQWQGFDRWLRDARHSFTGVLTGVRGRTLRLRSPASGRVAEFSIDPSSVDIPGSLDSLTGKEVRVDYRKTGFRPQVVRLDLTEPVASGDPSASAEIVAPPDRGPFEDQAVEMPEGARPAEPDPRPGGSTAADGPAETWSCTLDLHQGDRGELRFRRSGDAVKGSIVVRSGSQRHPISGTWEGERIEFWRALSDRSGQPFVGTASTLDDGTVRMGGRFANRYSGVWSADCSRSHGKADAETRSGRVLAKLVDVILVDARDRRIQVIKVVRRVTGLGLKESKEAVENTPFTVAAGVTADEAKEIVRALQVAGAEVEIKRPR